MHIDRPTTEARDAFLIGLAFLAYALLVYLARRKGPVPGAGVAASLDPRRMGFARSRRADMIAGENTGAPNAEL